MASLTSKVLAAAILLGLALCVPARGQNNGDDKVADALEAQVEDLLKQSENPTLPDDNRDALLKSAAQACEKLAARRMQLDPQIQWRSYAARVQGVDILGFRLLGSYADHITFLTARPRDAQVILKQSESVLATMAKIHAELDALLMKRRIGSRAGSDFVTPVLEENLCRLDYSRAWVKFYRGVAANSAGPAEARRVGAAALLAEAAETVKPEAESPGAGVQDWALLLRGTAFREMGKFDLARTELEKAAGDGMGDSVRARALFQLARTAIEAGWADRVPAAIETFRVQAEKTAPKQKAEIAAAVARLKEHARTKTPATKPAGEGV